jgi:hypothetical protein
MDVNSGWWLLGAFLAGIYAGALLMALMAMAGKEDDRAILDEGALAGPGSLDLKTLLP